MENNILISLENITKSYGNNTVLKNFDLEIKKNEFLTLLGPSGCGKTTILRIIGGFESPDEGNVIFDGEDITNLPSYDRKINTVFQKYALFPHLNVFDNIAFGLKIKKMPKDEIESRVNDVLKIVNLVNFNKRDIDSLSGGQQQRVAIARALVNEPEVVLLDEPLGALDLKLRQGMQIELKRLQEKVRSTFIYVTHDQEEALTMSDTIVVMNNGVIQQMGNPIDIYNEPKNAFVADFIGESNIIPGTMFDDYKVSFLNHTFECVDKGFEKNESVEIVIRPEDVKLVKNDGYLKGKVVSNIFKGVHYEMEIDINGYIMLIQSTVSSEVGEDVNIVIEPDLIHVMRK
ncbi:ABC transporter ATP-binding protein [Peptoniphilus catoniae]|uniref:ABC transporter ATP-binding protein n=1 Tax=Peptoniphilus catoniae TaxID=1660341 RepID=UPI0010FE23C2|nr:ABC transporter ATP-binding protein [Peptoniphilus catoniae]